MAIQLQVVDSRAHASKLVASRLWEAYEKEGVLGMRKRLDDEKKIAGRVFSLAHYLSNSDVITELQRMHGGSSEPLVRAIRKAGGRAMSGVSVIAIMTAPAWCPGQCTYCPTSAIAAKSYTGFEPAARRARANDFDAFKQVRSRIEQFEANGHLPSKCELIIMGGTFNSLDEGYQRSFLKGAYDACNLIPSMSLEHAIALNESAPHRVIGLVIETRPDWAGPEQIRSLLDWGMTRIELGVQSLDETVLERTKRGHTVAESVRATKDSKDAFLKVGHHLMLGAYSTPEKESRELPQVFSREDLRPDMLKIYPTLVVPGTELYDEWRKGEFTPYEEEDAARVIAEIKRACPPYVRIMRVDRDIPTPQIAAGVKKTNLREIVAERMKERGWSCRCIRCREAGLTQWKQGKQFDWSALELNRLEYDASGGKEVFLSFELPQEDVLAAYVRLRAPGGNAHPVLPTSTAGVRELRVVGEQVEVGKSLSAGLQHRQLGKQLMEEAEAIARNEWGADYLAVTAGVGVRPYYAKLGFTRAGPYMLKSL